LNNKNLIEDGWAKMLLVVAERDITNLLFLGCLFNMDIKVDVEFGNYGF
jgi:hypothetical protein